MAGERPANMIPKPKGQMSKDWTLNVEMKLTRSKKGLDTYTSLLRSSHYVVYQSQIPWEKYQWKDISSANKAILHAVMRERDPILARYENDWASESEKAAGIPANEGWVRELRILTKRMWYQNLLREDLEEDLDGLKVGSRVKKMANEERQWELSVGTCSSTCLMLQFGQHLTLSHSFHHHRSHWWALAQGLKYMQFCVPYA
ncbi:hypothetical protein L218DRAFT_1007096 [Marasmius fiardii PR-910]|nr:hypothetical protein L218DRAFT_1007096 [Marasmius fiardii PR-910]